MNSILQLHTWLCTLTYIFVHNRLTFIYYTWSREEDRIGLQHILFISFNEPFTNVKEKCPTLFKIIFLAQNAKNWLIFCPRSFFFNETLRGGMFLGSSFDETVSLFQIIASHNLFSYTKTKGRLHKSFLLFFWLLILLNEIICTLLNEKLSIMSMSFIHNHALWSLIVLHILVLIWIYLLDISSAWFYAIKLY